MKATRAMLLAALDHEAGRLDVVDDGVSPELSAQYQEVLRTALAEVEASLKPPPVVLDRIVARVLAMRAERHPR